MSINPNEASYHDQELTALRNKILNLFPDMEAEVLKMGMEDLLEILEVAENPDDQNRIEKIKEKMIRQILKMFPDMERELSVLDDKDIKEIYEQIVDKSEPMVKKEDFQAFEKNLPVVKKQHRPRNPIVKGPDGQINVYEMKKTLTERLPEFRNQIRNLPDEEIRTMFKELQEEQNKRRQSERKAKKQADLLNSKIGPQQTSYRQQPYSGHEYYPVNYHEQACMQQHNSFYPNYQHIKSIPVASGYRGENPHPSSRYNVNNYPTPYPYVFQQEDIYQKDYGIEFQKSCITPDQKEQVSYIPPKTKQQKIETTKIKHNQQIIKKQQNWHYKSKALIDFNNGVLAKIKVYLTKEEEKSSNTYKQEFEQTLEYFGSNQDCYVQRA